MTYIKNIGDLEVKVEIDGDNVKHTVSKKLGKLTAKNVVTYDLLIGKTMFRTIQNLIKILGKEGYKLAN